MYEVLGHERFGLPLDMAHLPWRIAPPAGTTFDWSDLHLADSVLSRDAEITLNGILKYARIVSCPSQAKDKLSYGWAYALTAVGTPDSYSPQLVSWVVTIAPPLTLRNLLRTSIQYKLIEMKVSFERERERR